MLLAKLIWSLVRAIAKSWMELSMLTFPQRASGSTYIHVEPVPDSRNFKLKKQVDLTTALTKELDSTMEEVEF
jgi:gas vesicle protein